MLPVYFVKEDPSIVAAGLFISYSTCCWECCRACSQGGVPLDITAFSTQTKRIMWFDRYLAQSYVFTMLNNTQHFQRNCYLNVLRVTAKVFCPLGHYLIYLYQDRGQRAFQQTLERSLAMPGGIPSLYLLQEKVREIYPHVQVHITSILAIV